MGFGPLARSKVTVRPVPDYGDRDAVKLLRRMQDVLVTARLDSKVPSTRENIATAIRGIQDAIGMIRREP